jgi:hypothetical protein
MKKKVLEVLFTIILLVGVFGTAHTLSSYLSQFNTRYGTAGSALNQCMLCHTSNINPSALNPYGTAFLGSGHNFAAIETLDSDGDGFSNIDEINARTFPGDPNSKPSSDTVPPTVTTFTMPSTSTTLTVPITAFTATDNVGVTGYIVTESATAPLASATGWTATSPTSYIFTTSGTKTLYAWAKDAAGNVSTSLSGMVNVTGSTGSPIFASLSDGGLYKSADGGETWTPILDHPQITALLATDNTIYVGLQDSQTLRPKDGGGHVGKHWSLLRQPNT